MQALDDLMFLPSFVFTDWQIELTLLAREVPDLGASQRPYLPSSFFWFFFGVGFYSSCTVFFLLQGVLIFCCHSFSLHCRFHKKKSYMYTWLGKEPFTTELARTARDLRPCSNVDTLSTSVPSWII